MIQKFLLSLLATVVTTNIINSFPAEAQQTGKVPRIGFSTQALLPGARSFRKHSGRSCASSDGLKEKILLSSTDSQSRRLDLLPDLAAELVRLKSDLIVDARYAVDVSGEEREYYHTHRDDEHRPILWVQFG